MAAIATSPQVAAAAGTNLSLVAYSTPKPVMGKIIQAWQQTPDGTDVSFTQSYGPSTNQASAVGQRPARRPWSSSPPVTT